MSGSERRRAAFGRLLKHWRTLRRLSQLALDLPLRARNELLAAAGLAVEFPASEIGGSMLAPYRSALQRLLGGLNPFPAAR